MDVGLTTAYPRKFLKSLENLILANDWSFSFENWQAVQNIFVGIVHPMALSPATLVKRVDLAEKALVAAEKLGNQEMLAWLHLGALGYALKVIGKPDEALNHVKIGQLIAQEAGLIDCIAYANYRLANWAMERGDYDSALQYIQTALSSATSPSVKFRAYAAQSEFHARLGELEEAKKLSLIATEIASEDDSNLEIWARKRLGNIQQQIGELDAAEKAYLRVQEIASEYGLSKDIADSMMGLAQINHKRGATQMACTYAEQARVIYERLGRTNRIKKVNEFIKDLNSP